MGKRTKKRGKKKTVSMGVSDRTSEEGGTLLEGEGLSIEPSNPVLKKEMEALLKHLKGTLEEHEKSKILKTRNPILVYLNRYLGVFDLTLPEEHRDYFLKVYTTYRMPILSNKSDDWLRKNSIRIRYGAEAGLKRVCIMLSSIYNTACKLRDAAEERLEGRADEEEYEHCFDLIRCEVILLHLYRIFREIAPEKDRDKLREIIVQLETDLGPGEDPKPNLLSGLEDLGKQLSTGMGPGGAPIPDLGKMIQSMMSNGAIQNLVSQMASSLQNVNSFEEAMGKVTTMISDENIRDSITETMTETVAGAWVPPSSSTGKSIVGPGPQGLIWEEETTITSRSGLHDPCCALPPKVSEVLPIPEGIHRDP